MAVSRCTADGLLARCHRRCCICHCFCGVKMELHHIDQAADGGSDYETNLIPVCFECHAEIQLYNDRHPRGRKYHPNELRQHREQWLRVCQEMPREMLIPVGPSEAGPLQALIDEIDFNAGVAAEKDCGSIGCPFEVRQFDRALDQGLVALLADDLRAEILKVYRHLKRANASLSRVNARADGLTEAQGCVFRAGPELQSLREVLLGFLSRGRAANEEID